MNFVTLFAEERLGKKNQILKINALLDWRSVRKQLVGIHQWEEHKLGGPRGYNPVKMFKALLLGQWHSLSDPKLEESLRVRLDFILFTGFEMGEELPDETTLCRFRNRLGELGLFETLFREINLQLEKQGLKVEAACGAIVDATVIQSAAHPRRVIEMAEDRKENNSETTGVLSPARMEESRDPDARWLKKGKGFHFGYKGFVRTDASQGYITAVVVTSANVAETKLLDSLTRDCPSGSRVLTDKAYDSRGNRQMLKDRRLKNGILYKASRNLPLSHWQKVFNKLVSRNRYLVEQCFGTLKRRFSFRRSSYFGQPKVLPQLQMKAICFNLLKAVNKISLCP